MGETGLILDTSLSGPESDAVNLTSLVSEHTASGSHHQHSLDSDHRSIEQKSFTIVRIYTFTFPDTPKLSKYSNQRVYINAMDGVVTMTTPFGRWMPRGPPATASANVAQRAFQCDTSGCLEELSIIYGLDYKKQYMLEWHFIPGIT
ncbi:hypothetical protein PGT21_025235 [Puccinia graminis f. sp. tritici]|uniref:Uncharacterized protein n=1 Tax=Puccinia graminis f. sp. tritici TaxID=56615 RepID=A0A5B0LRP7_PUCGR|nr:hypothetical protein PGT21_025235 [Puccinia graminis f. sp. tritici]KAA1072689.1 hypothetical protein PGTUg99_018081 [Puccinia graminis f. sp. tritici]